MIGENLALHRVRRVIVLVEMDDIEQTKHGFELTNVSECRWERTDMGGDAHGRIVAAGRLYRKKKNAASAQFEEALREALPPGGE